MTATPTKGKKMAQTENGQKIYDYYVEADVMSFASDWTEFTLYYSNHWGNRTNYTAEWHKWCDEFAEWVIDNSPVGDDLPYGLIDEKGEEE